MPPASSLLRNSDQGSFLAREEFATGLAGEAFEPKSVEAEDLNGDGFADIAASGETVGKVAVLLGDGQGGLQAPVVIPVGSPSGNTLRVADFDSNGRPDILVSSTVDNVVYLLPADPTSPTLYISPPADFSTLVENADGSFTRRLKDGTRFEFRPDGRMTAVKRGQACIIALLSAAR